MLANGKEVNHLIIAGETFDKSYIGKKCTLLKDHAWNGQVNKDGSYISTSGGIIIKSGAVGDVLFKYGNCFYIFLQYGKSGDSVVNVDIGTWVDSSSIKITD